MRVAVFIFFLFLSILSGAQPTSVNVADSIVKTDSLKADSASQPNPTSLADSLPQGSVQKVQTIDRVEINAPFSESFSPPTRDTDFFLLLLHLLLLALLRVVFPKYYATLFRVFTKSAIRQKALREQMTQNKLATLLANVFFCISAGAFVFLVFRYHNIIPAGYAGWQLLTASIVMVGLVYSGKYLFTAFGGWALGWQQMAEAYNFLVFLLNKMAGIALVPILVMMALGSPYQQQWAMAIGFVLLGALLTYRFVAALPMASSQLRGIGIHFFLYLCAFEIIPLLVLCKVLLNYVLG